MALGSVLCVYTVRSPATQGSLWEAAPTAHALLSPVLLCYGRMFKCAAMSVSNMGWVKRRGVD